MDTETMQKKHNLPMIALRGMTILPGMIVHFDVSRKKSIAALEKAMVQEQCLFLVTQKSPEEAEPDIDQLYTVGVTARVSQIIKLQNSAVVRVLVTANARAELLAIEDSEGYQRAEVLETEPVNHLDAVKSKAMVQVLWDLICQYAEINPKFSKDIIKNLLLETNIAELILSTANHMPLHYTQKQQILESDDVELSYEWITRYLVNEIEVGRIRNDFQIKVREKIDKNQKEYILREQLKLIREELGEEDIISEADAFLQETEKLKAPKEVKERLRKEIKRFRGMASNSSESSVIRGYIENILEMPWSKTSKDRIDIERAKEILDEDHYGLEKVKERIIEFLAVKQFTKGKGISPIICLVGPPGTGKTSIAKSLARALNKKYIRICLGGVRDEAEIRGHRKTYVGAMPGKIVKGMKQAGVKNPLMLLDEIDKLGNDYKGDPASALLEVLDSEQNERFVDHYMEIPVDLSEVLFVATANTVQTIPRPLLDRMEVIEITSYTANEKEHIAKEHLLGKQKKAHGLSDKQFNINKKALQILIQNYTKEAGVRSLERTIARLCRKATVELVESHKKTVKITEHNVEQYLGKMKYMKEDMSRKDQVGIATGLAWTSVGGETLEIEVNIMQGKGNMNLTGKLGDVMKESAITGLSFVKSIAKEYDISSKFFRENDIHIHIPEGAVPKDGPSAGITMATAILSAVTKTPIHADVAMTGEVTLRGRVLPIGGLKEKLLAAGNAGIKTVLVPKKNKADVAEISEEIKKGLKIIYVEHMTEVLEQALCR